MKTAEFPRSPSHPAPSAHQRTHDVPISIPSSQKINAEHQSKLAVVYVRQSSPQQILQNRESTARQYALADYANCLGWAAERVVVIDEDQGQSGARADGRSGFQRLLSEVTMDHVGIVLGLEMSRLARSSKDWHHLLELCGVFGTLLGDQDGIYDPTEPNDRLLLGLKGTMSEVELHTMRNRLERGRINKAQRGELFFSVPLGYVLLPTGKVDFDPDEQARSVVHLLFEKFEELGSARALFCWLVQHGVSLPIRLKSGPNKGELEWRRPSLATLNQTLHHPIYAGAYAYGRRPEERKRSYAVGAGRKARWLPMDQWQILILDHLPAYITWNQFLSNQERLNQNQTRSDTRCTPRNGRALLPGLLICGNCNWRMQVDYGTKDKPYYRCSRHLTNATEKSCCGVSAAVVDELVSRNVLRALEPAALELSVKAQTDLRRERERLDKHWKQKLQRARYDVELAERRYRGVDPDNRLVAATLERQWEEALLRERQVKEECDRCSRETMPRLTEDDESRIIALASDIPALWDSPKTTNADRQAIVRCLVERVVVQVEANSEHAEATIQWVGGYESRHEFSRPVRTYGQLSNGDLLVNRIVELREAGKTAEQTAETLNKEGFKPISPGDTFNRDIVRDLLLKLGLRTERNDASLLGPNEWWVRDLAKEIGMPWQTLREWATKGWVCGRQTNVEKLWIMWADQSEIERLRKLRNSRSCGVFGYPANLTTPKHRADVD